MPSSKIEKAKNKRKSPTKSKSLINTSSSWKNSHVRPEDTQVATDFYTQRESERYASSNAMHKMQTELTLRAVQLAQLPIGSHVLDAGCGSGFSTEVLQQIGYKTSAFDLSPHFVSLAKQRNFECKQGDLRNFPFTEKFDGIFSISALQWITANPKTAPAEAAKAALEFNTHLRPGGKAVIQFYPKTEEELLQTAQAFKQNGFHVNIVTDNPKNPRKRKIYLLLEKK
ncbi:MAG: class I SAM-dependent methyltransferase [Candidatus Woesearchaeota archaeon]|nr:class I SAM-dependent methyltransferase [Candidatus Woesearchaeota archaeon]